MATAISYRHGTSAQHKDFRGAPSEITVSTDELTLYVHSGEESLPGVPLARADFNNVEASTIKSKGILDNKLTNFMGGNYTNIVNDKNPELGARIANYLDLIHQLGIKHTEDNVEVDNYALTNLNNVTTTEHLANRKTNPNNSKDKSLAYADLTNVDSSILTKESGSFKLATLNLDNINSDGENKILDTVKNGNLGYATEDYVNSYVDSHTPSVVGFEKLSNKVQKIDSNASDIDLANNYPSIAALLTYLSNDLIADYANVNLSNVIDWEYATYINQSNKLVINCTNPGSGYVKDTSIINTNITVLKGDIDPVETNLTIYVKEVDENGGILSFDIDPIYTQTSILSSSPTSYTDNVGKASFTIYTNELDTPGKLAKADLSNTDALSKTEANSTYLKKSNAQSTYATITNLNNHTGNTNNPHNVTKAQVGLENVNNTSDADKPVSTAQAAALDALESNLQLQITSNDTDISNLQNSKADKATTLAGYNIEDAYTKSEADNTFIKKSDSSTQIATTDWVNSLLKTYDYIAERQEPTAENNYTWYRKYKSGWIEQGGTLSLDMNKDLQVTLPVPMKNASYQFIQGSTANFNTIVTNINGWGVKNKSTTSFTVVNYTGVTNSLDWFICGLSAA